MTANPFAALLRGVPRLAMETTVNGEHIIVCNDGPFVRYDRVLAALAAAVPADLAEAGKVLAKLQSQIGDDVQDVYLPEALHKLSANTITALIARLAAQEAQIKGLEATVERFARAHERHLISGAETRARAEAAETALAAMTKERDEYKRLALVGELIANEQRITEGQLAAERAKVAKLVEAAKAMQADMLERARIGTDTIHGEEYRIVNAGRTAWADFCTAITEAGQ